MLYEGLDGSFMGFRVCASGRVCVSVLGLVVRSNSRPWRKQRRLHPHGEVHNRTAGEARKDLIPTLRSVLQGP